MSTCNAIGAFEKFGCFCGTLSAFIYFVVQFPQIYKNYKRKATIGFSHYYVVIRLFGISFFVVNSIIKKVTWVFILAGFLLFFSYSILLIQHAYYEFKHWDYLYFLMIIIPLVLSICFPSTINITDFVSPICQVVCYIPYIIECLQKETTSGISMLSLHFNFLGAIFGILMCTISIQCDSAGWLLHIISICQSCAIYLIAIDYDEFELFDTYKKAPEGFRNHADFEAMGSA
ncbi:PQ loop repeat family protein [Trichomonas vaginalis G3]|uniref:PQ loop repeat family protein n=1 Tax=Trichomonas vaginalis (strain ATCC PRA-98 / G3) TaxID=412133 RepID=A2FB49_TRIV3|nr:cystinosin family [Trichomonas vaginalis G3]EAX97884.1 PQ loop repeat family protein [Trichomonas vaginalis G3]KAI5501163.1 cystinosin family [Trichomonas vaginalis G3]|eukprot:XP_001310814.1 PQ loop repeat family protein [Trichomonas vaginalis G3]